MTPERWQQIEEIFHEALDLSGGARTEFLKEKTGGDSELREEVEKLLSQFDEASGFIEKPLYDSGKSGFLSSLLDDGASEADDPVLGTLLGTYRIEKEIGRGGMGAVYEAFRADGEFRRRVAVKVVKRGVDTDFVLRRFRNERQILAALDHPYITRLIDGGTTPDGRPYFVMEFIDGQTLYRYCDRNRLDVAERLKLFCRICEAVEYAHQKLVIHRDIKPSNIFISSDGSPRLLDFGIAKLLDPEMASDTLQPTATALRMMTVDYASPEQVRGDKVTFATDVYSLGVILFELLTHRRPYRLKGRSPHEVARAICDDAPILPSVAAAGDEDELAVVKVSPSAPTLAGEIFPVESPADLSDQLRGNLDSIVMKALSKDVSDRYESVAEFRKDIEKHLKGGAVSHDYKFIPRKESATTLDKDAKLLAVLPLSLLGPTGNETTDESYLTVGLADAIITRLTSVQQLTVRPTSSITRYNEQQINPFRAGLELGVDFVLDGRIRRFGERLRISLQLLDVKGGSAIWAGQFDEHLTDVLELEDAISEQVAEALIPQLTGEQKQKLAKRGTNDSEAYEAYLRSRFHWNQFTADSLGKAIEALNRAIEIDPNYALAYVGIADFYIWASIYGLVPVRESYTQALAAAEKALEIDPELGEAYASMGLIMLNRFEYERSERMFLKALDLSPKYPLAHEWYSSLLVGNGRADEGLDEMHRAEQLDPLSLRTKVLVVWTNYQAGEFENALAKAEEIIRLDSNYPQGHLQRGYVLAEMGRGDESVASCKRGLDLMPDSGLAQFHMCFALAAAGRRDEAMEYVDAMIERSKREYVKPMFLAFAYVAVGMFDEAFECFDIALSERDPWLAWLTTEPKLRAIRTDPRFEKLLRGTRKSLSPRRMRSMSNTDPDIHTSFHSSSTKLMSAADMPTRETAELQRSFLRRHALKIGTALISIALIVGAYATGVLTVQISPAPAGFAPNAVRSIAVMPFVNNTGESDSDYISDGLTEGLISRLSGSSTVRAAPRSASFSYKTKNVDALTAAKELGVDNVVTGSLSKKGSDYHLQIEMLETETGRRRLTMGFIETPERIFALADALSTRVMDALELNRDTVAARKGYTENNDAFQAYLKGEYSRQKGTPAGTTEAIELFKRAIDLDPDFALAYQGLSLAYRSAPAYGAMTPPEAFPKAKEAAEKALSIDPTLSTANVTLAAIRSTYDWDFPEAEKEYQRAIQLSPNSSEAHYSYGNFLVAMGRSDEAMTQFRFAQQIDPLSLNIQTNLGWAMYIAGDFDAATMQIRQVLGRDPNFARAYLNLGEILQEQGKFDEAITAIQRARELSKDPLADMALGHAYAAAGRRAEAQKVAQELEEKVLRKEVSPFLPAVVYAGLDEKDRSFYWLERAYQERSNWLTLIKVGRRMKNLRGDPRFDDLLSRIGFRS